MIRETTEADIRYVCGYMRAEDAEEHYALRFFGDDTPEALARDMIERMPLAIQSFCFVTSDGDPATILSAYLTSPGVARLHRISTNQWDQVARKVFRFGVEKFMPAIAASVHRAECSILAKHDLARWMLERLGFTMQMSAIARGRNREDFIDFAWVKS